VLVPFGEPDRPKPSRPAVDVLEKVVVDSLVMLHAQPPGWERFASALRRNRSLETLQRGGIPQAWDVL
jgi:hypothetical protein